jgi:hypothetical protein
MGIWHWLKRRWSRGRGPTAGRAPERDAPRTVRDAPAAVVRPPVVRPDVSRPSGVAAPKRQSRQSQGGPAPAAQGPRPVPELPSDLLQFSAQPKGALTDVVVGFDFGTSSAKVAMQTPYALGGRTVIIDFGPLGHESCTYLLPAAVCRNDSGVWRLAGSDGHAEHRRHLKLPLIGEIRNGQAPDQDSTAWAVAFVALALREARRVFLRTQADPYSGIRLRWAMNLGIPSAGYDDAGIRSRFLEVARAAWLASLTPEIGSTTVATAVAAARTTAPGDVPIAVVPEVAAEMVGYARSRYRRLRE